MLTGEESGSSAGARNSVKLYLFTGFSSRDKGLSAGSPSAAGRQTRAPVYPYSVFFLV